MVKIVETPRALLGTEGTKLDPTGWLSIEQARIDEFANCTGDHQWIHVDVEKARTGPFGTTIAHGYLTLSLVSLFLPQLLEVRGFSSAVNVGLDRVRFIAPVPCGARIRAAAEITQVEEVKGGAIQSTVRVTIELEGGEKPACIADTISRYFPES